MDQLVQLLPVPFDEKTHVSPDLTLTRAVVIVRHGLRTPLHRLDEVLWNCSNNRVLHSALDVQQQNQLFVLRPILFQQDLNGTVIRRG
jgi:hypothetical protein